MNPICYGAHLVESRSPSQYAYLHNPMPHMQRGEGSGHYFDDFNISNPDYADGWYIRKAKSTRNDVREMLIDMKLRQNRIQGERNAECGLHRTLETGYNRPDHNTIDHLDYKHKKGRFEHLYRKYK